ncbi:hypothetical protein RSSE_c3265 [Ralstonia solanacearum]|nr:hypothetical protein RSSE_c3265 [Ralstonia solanacearum]
MLPAIVLVCAAGCGEANKPEDVKASPTPNVEATRPKLTAAEAKQLASDTLAYFDTKYKNALADDGVMNKDALLRVFNGPELQAIVQRWPTPFTGDVEAGKYVSCQNLPVSASSYAHAQHDYAFNGLSEKNVLPLRTQFKQDLKDCKKALAS